MADISKLLTSVQVSQNDEVYGPFFLYHILLKYNTQDFSQASNSCPAQKHLAQKQTCILVSVPQVENNKNSFNLLRSYEVSCS